jgi:hypothetical protein
MRRMAHLPILVRRMSILFSSRGSVSGRCRRFHSPRTGFVQDSLRTSPKCSSSPSHPSNLERPIAETAHSGSCMNWKSIFEATRSRFIVTSHEARMARPRAQRYLEYNTRWTSQRLINSNRMPLPNYTIAQVSKQQSRQAIGQLQQPASWVRNRHSIPGTV